jgi:hypothetical protein
MVTMKLQNKWIWITENFEILLCYHTTEGRLICAVFHRVPKQSVLSPPAATPPGGWVVA